jgi:hypothetical protein
MAQKGCTSACDYDKKCLQHVDFMKRGEALEQFFGVDLKPPEGAKARAQIIKSIYDDLAKFDVRLFLCPQLKCIINLFSDFIDYCLEKNE